MKKLCPNFKIVKVTLFSLFFIFLFNAHVAAQVMSSLSLTATPVRLGDDFSIILSPGEKKQVQVKIRNGSDQEISLESKAVDFTVAEDGATPIILGIDQADPRWSLASWLTLVPAENKLVTEEVATVNVLIEVPENALPGGHYAMVYHRPINTNENTDSGSGVSQRVGTLLYVIVKGLVNEEAYISQFNWPKFLENGPVDFSLKIDNQSDIHINTQPVVKIYNIFGKEVANVELEPKNIFPKTERAFSGSWDRVWGFGYYKAVVESTYGTQGGVMTASAGLYMIPVKLILLTLIIVLVTLIIFLSIKKKKQAKEVDINSDSNVEVTDNEDISQTEKK